MGAESQNKKGSNYGLYLILGIIMWLIAFASFDPLVDLRNLLIGKILFVAWLVFLVTGWVIFMIGCIKRFKAKYYR